jgi:hypothetical protein
MKEHFPYLLWAYNLIWILIAAYVGVIYARQRSIRRQIDDLRRRLAPPGGPPAGAGGGLIAPGGDGSHDGESAD